MTTTAPDLSTEPIHRPGWGPWMLVVPLLLAMVLRNRVALFDDETLRLWSTLFVSICIQALPFLVLGVVLSGAIVAFVSPDLVRRILPNRPALAVPVAGLAGVALPGCQCGSVPIAGHLGGGGGRMGAERRRRSHPGVGGRLDRRDDQPAAGPVRVLVSPAPGRSR